MKRAFLKPVLHIVPLPKGTDVAMLSQHSDEELLKVYRQGKQEEEDVVLRANPDIIVREIGDEWILVPTGEMAQYFNGMVSLNEFGHFIWQQFAEPCSIGQVLQAARECYGDTNHMQDIEIRSFIKEYFLMGLFLINGNDDNNNNKN